jgi:hypothetical protein
MESRKTSREVSRGRVDGCAFRAGRRRLPDCCRARSQGGVADWLGLSTGRSGTPQSLTEPWAAAKGHELLLLRQSEPDTHWNQDVLRC